MPQPIAGGAIPWPASSAPAETEETEPPAAAEPLPETEETEPPAATGPEEAPGATTADWHPANPELAEVMGEETENPESGDVLIPLDE